MYPAMKKSKKPHNMPITMPLNVASYPRYIELIKCTIGVPQPKYLDTKAKNKRYSAITAPNANPTR